MCIVYLVKVIVGMHVETAFSHIKNPMTAVLLTLLAAVGFSVIVFISSFAWKCILEFLYGAKIAFGEIRDVYVKANIAKYLPGGVMHFAGRNVLGHKLGFSQIDMALSTIIEVITLIITALVWSLILSYQSLVTTINEATGRFSVWLYLIAGIVVVAVIAAAVIYAHKKGLLQKYRKLFSLAFLKVFLLLFVIYTVTMLIPAALLVFIISGVLGVSLTIHAAILVVTAYMLSWVVGYVVPIPGGLGIREAILVLILSPVCGPQIATVAALLHRVASIIGDVIAFFVEVILAKITMKG